MPRLKLFENITDLDLARKIKTGEKVAYQVLFESDFYVGFI